MENVVKIKWLSTDGSSGKIQFSAHKIYCFWPGELPEIDLKLKTKRERERTGSGSFVFLFGFFSSKKKSISPNLISHLSNKKLDFRINRFNFENERLGAFDLIIIKYLNDYEI